jgi:hypothetical protein
MATTYQVSFEGKPADQDFYTALGSLQVEENADLPGAIQLHLPISRNAAGDLTFVSDKRLKPLANVAVVVTLEGQAPQCIFDGYVLSHKLHLETGVTASTLEVWGQDASWLMNLEEKVHEWVDMTDGQVANAIFGDYGITPSPDNSADDSPTHTEDGHSLMQHATDIQFLRTRARLNGKLCRVTCADRPGQRTGYFAKPRLDGQPVVTLKLNDPVSWTVSALDFTWDITRPSAIKAGQSLFTDPSPDGVSADTGDSGLPLLDSRGLTAFAGKPMTVLLAAPVDDAGELKLRAQAVLREANWFVRCEGEADAGRVNAVLRAGAVVAVEGVGALHSGKYFVWSVQHTIDNDSHKMRFVLLRNAVGPEPAGGTGGLLGGLG